LIEYSIVADSDPINVNLYISQLAEAGRPRIGG
jgi:hypothetical protein